MNASEIANFVATVDEKSENFSIGVYVIVNKITLQAYIGQSKNIKRRFGEHATMLRSGKHHNRALQEDWMKYGEGAFLLCHLSEVSADELISEESRFIEEFGFTYNRDDRVNVAGRKQIPDALRREICPIRLPAWLLAWLRDQPESAGELVEQALCTQHGLSAPSS